MAACTLISALGNLFTSLEKGTEIHDIDIRSENATQANRLRRAQPWVVWQHYTELIMPAHWNADGKEHMRWLYLHLILGYIFRVSQIKNLPAIRITIP